MIGDAMSIRRRGHRKSPATKRSVVIDGRQTGVSLEDAFWSILKDIAQAQGATVSQTVTEIEKSRQRETCPPRSACSYSTGSAVDKWVSRSRRSGRTSPFGNDLKPKQKSRVLNAAPIATIDYPRPRGCGAIGPTDSLNTVRRPSSEFKALMATMPLQPWVLSD